MRLLRARRRQFKGEIRYPFPVLSIIFLGPLYNHLAELNCEEDTFTLAFIIVVLAEWAIRAI